MFIIGTSSYSDSLKWEKVAKQFYFYTQVGGGQDKLAWTAYPPPQQLSIQNNLTKETAEFDLNYVYNWYIIIFR